MQMLHEKLYKLDHERNCEVEDLKKKVICLYIILYISFISYILFYISYFISLYYSTLKILSSFLFLTL